jgi:hypothetical protein
MTIQNGRFEVTVQLRPSVRDVYRTAPSAAPPMAYAPRHGQLPRITQVLALAIQFQEMLDHGEARNYADLARLGCVCRERISQVMALTWLAPDIQEAVLRLTEVPGGRFPISEGALRRIAQLPGWESQRQQWQRQEIEDAAGCSS